MIMSGTGGNLFSGVISPQIFQGAVAANDEQNFIHIDSLNNMPGIEHLVPKNFNLGVKIQGSIEQTVDEAAEEVSTESEN